MNLFKIHWMMYRAVEYFYSNIHSIIDLLQEFSNDSSDATFQNSSKKILKSIKSAYFFLCLPLFYFLLKKLDILCRFFQKSNLHLESGVKQLNLLVDYLDTAELNQKYDSFWNVSNAYYQRYKIDFEKKLKKVFKLPQFELEYIYSRFYDVIYSDLKRKLSKRFNENNKNLLVLIHYLDPEKKFQDLQIHHLIGVLQIFKHDFMYFDLNELEVELSLFKKFIMSCKPHKSLSETYKIIIEEKLVQFYPNISNIIKLILNTAITSVKCEKTYSKMKFIKDSFSNTMCEDNLNTRVRMSSESDLMMEIEFEEIVDRFLALNPNRKIKLKY